MVSCFPHISSLDIQLIFILLAGEISSFDPGTVKEWKLRDKFSTIKFVLVRYA